MAKGRKRTVDDAFSETAHKYFHKTAVIYLGTAYSYGTIMKLIDNFASALKDLGVGAGDRVVMYIPNSIQWVVCWFAIQRVGAVSVPITPIYTSYDLEYIANDTEAESIICADTNFGYVQRALPKTKLKRVVVSNLVDLLPWWKRLFGWAFDKVPRGSVPREENVYSFRRLVSRSSHKTAPIEGRDGTVEILYTGGTTKHPKGVPISHELFLIASLEQLSVSDHLFPKEENLIAAAAPLFHILGQTCGLGTLCLGGSLILQPRVNLDALLESIQRSKAKTLIGVPTLYRMILEHDRVDQYDFSSLAYCFSGGDVLPLEVGKRWREKFGKPIFQGYGATETCGGVTMYPTDTENPPKSMGVVLPSKRVKIVDADTLESVPVGEAGELLVSSFPMVKSYYNKPEETRASFVEMEGRIWYRTGDVVSQDEKKYFYFVDRTVDAIKHRGYRVSSSEIESVLQEHAAVVGSCVVGVSDDKVGERIKAFVVLKEDIKGITGYDLIKWCRERLAPYKVPQYIEFRDMLPKSKVGKLLRREMRKEERKRFEKI
ncbi:MAG: AMP-binding protein [Proteobacteria bacterium]|nr:AMP-binding protein [Pseudomonadota bacterium]